MLILFNRDCKFPLGSIVATKGVSDLARKDPHFAAFASNSFARHCEGDWGDLDDHDKLMNERALQTDDRILSRYVSPAGVAIYIITEWDRSATTILFPEEY